MKILKKILCCFLFVLVLFSSIMFASCDLSPTNNKKNIVCTIFPEYDWVMEILKEKADCFNVTCLASNGEDLHSFEPSVKDVVTIASADLFIYVGGESDLWVQDALKNKKNNNMKTINLLEELGDNVKDEEIKEGMQGESDGEEDEHVWLSLKNAKLFINSIAENIAKIDEANKNYYLKNAEDYNKKLDELDYRTKQVVSSGDKKALVFADRFPFRYYFDDYSLNYYAAFSGCSAESEASFETIIFLANKVDDLKLNTILIIENSSDRLAQSVRSNTKTKDQKILVLNSMQSVKITDGKSYISIMNENLLVLEEALG